MGTYLEDCVDWQRQRYRRVVLILAILVAGMGVGALAQLILGRSGQHLDWSMALVAGLVGSFVGGLLISLLAGDGLSIRPSGLIGSVVGALAVTAAWIRLVPDKQKEAIRSRRR